MDTEDNNLRDWVDHGMWTGKGNLEDKRLDGSVEEKRLEPPYWRLGGRMAHLVFSGMWIGKRISNPAFKAFRQAGTVTVFVNFDTLIIAVVLVHLFTQAFL
ncbi:unnamed protein product [Symbiodinium natans]|uniref:Uncharacterized protein n=1 Tax=Symbiodinium natans TaxID=878477 RepID=A0A812J0R9_9DINO|nr:unnamed protein product [Symbiodinium natans]